MMISPNFRRNRLRLRPAPSWRVCRKKLLGHPNGGALAFIGHVERNWGHSITAGKNTDIAAFTRTLSRLMQGHTVGSAVEPFNQRYAFLSSRLSDELQQAMFFQKPPEEAALMDLRISAIDARNYIIIGDPAVRLPIRAEAAGAAASA